MAPLGNPCLDVPGLICRYLSPMLPFSRTVKWVSTGSGLMFSYSFRLSTAIGRPEAVRAGSTLDTVPARAPPMLAWSPFCSSLASAIWTWRS